MIVSMGQFGFSIPSAAEIEKNLKKAAALLPANTWVGKYGRGEASPLDAAIAQAKKLGYEIDPTRITPEQRVRLEEEMRRARAESQSSLKVPLLIGGGLALAAILALVLLRRRSRS